MAKEIRTEIIIQASPQKVWQVLTDFKSYPEWNPFIKSIEGRAQVGNSIRALIQPPNQKVMTFQPKVLIFDIDNHFAWIGHLFLHGLFDGEHHFELIDNKNGTTTFKHYEKFKGILLFVFGKDMQDNTRKGFELMNEAIKKRAESL